MSPIKSKKLTSHQFLAFAPRQYPLLQLIGVMLMETRRNVLSLIVSLVVKKISNFPEFPNQVDGTNRVPGTINLRILLDAR